MKTAPQTPDEISFIVEGLASLTRLADLVPRLEQALERMERVSPPEPAPSEWAAPRAFSIAETAAEVRCSRSKVYHLIDTGHLKTVRIGTRRLVLAKSVKRLIATGGPSRKSKRPAGGRRAVLISCPVGDGGLVARNRGQKAHRQRSLSSAFRA